MGTDDYTEDAVSFQRSNSFLQMVVLQCVVSFKTSGGVWCWFFWASCAIIWSCVPSLSTADYTIVVSGVLMRRWNFLFSWMGVGRSLGWLTVGRLQMLMHQVINYRSTEVDRGEWSGLCFRACFLVQNAAVHCWSILGGKRTFSATASGFSWM